MAESLPEATVVPRRRGLSIVWLIPLVALAIAGYLGYRTLSEKGPRIEITFKTASGLESGKTAIKYKDVQMGIVNDIRLSDDLKTISVLAQMDKDAERHLGQQTQFWVVRPRLSAAGVSGLETLVSGAHIEMDPAGGAPSRNFVGLEEPPVIRADVPGTEYLLTAKSVGSLGVGALITYRGIEVGQIISFALDEDGEGVTFRAFVKAPFDKLVRTGTDFWNVSGVDLSLSADGVQLRSQSLLTILAGGITFETPAYLHDSDPAPSDTKFTLFPSQEVAADSRIRQLGRFVAYFDGSVRGLKEGAPVELRGIQIGRVTDIRMEIDRAAERIRIPVQFAIEWDRMRLGGVKVVDPSAIAQTVEEQYGRAKALVGRGLRAKLKSGNILTGALYVDLDFYPEAPPAELRTDGPYPEVPSLPSDLEQIQRSVTEVADKLKSLPLEELIQDMRTAVRSINALVSSPDVLATIRSFRETASSAEGVMDRARATLAAADDMLGSKSQVRYELTQALSELSDAMRSIRLLADYLEQHPEALVHGKGAPSR